MRLVVGVYEPRETPAAGGLFLLEGRTVKMLDPWATTGLCFAGDNLVRIRWAPRISRLDIWSKDGQHRELSVPGGDPHEIAWTGSELVVVSTLTNELIWMTLDGEVTRRWQATEVPDAWHLSGVGMYPGGVAVTAFGRHETTRGWQGVGEPIGFLHDPDAGVDLMTGLRSPHTPRWIEGEWWVCESLDKSIVRGSAHIPVDGWARGIAVQGRLVAVGISAFRRRLPKWRGKRVVVPSRQEKAPRVEVWDRETLEKQYSVTLPLDHGDAFSVIEAPDDWPALELDGPPLNYSEGGVAL